MQYSEFIRTLQKHTSSMLQAMAVPSSCVPIQIPRIFLHAFPNIATIIKTNAAKICTQPKQRIIIFNLQPVSIAVKSNLPKKLNRITNLKHPENHLCCGLGYVLLNDNENFSHIQTHKQQSLFIDFTTGLVTDINYYLNIFCPVQPLPENIYGTINQGLLQKIWSAFLKQQYGDNSNVRNHKKTASYTYC